MQKPDTDKSRQAGAKNYPSPEALKKGRDFLANSLGVGVPLEDYKESVALVFSAMSAGVNQLDIDAFDSLRRDR
jgi:hypothetical protein